MDTPDSPPPAAEGGATILSINPKKPSAAPTPSAVIAEVATFCEWLLSEAQAGHIVGIAVIAKGTVNQYMHKVQGEMPIIETLGMIEILRHDVLQSFDKVRNDG